MINLIIHNFLQKWTNDKKVQKFNYVMLLSLIIFSIVTISCGRQSTSVPKISSTSSTASENDSKRYWHIKINVPMDSATIEQEFWFDSKEDKLVRIKDMFNDVIGKEKVADFGYKIISGDFNSTTIVLEDAKPPYVKYIFETTAFVTVKLMNSVYCGTWGISGKSSKYK